MSNKQPTRTVFLGDIPYDFQDADIRKVAADIGMPPIEVRLVWDREKQRHKGYGFLEYENVQQAIQAREALNGKPIHGRKLRSDYSNEPKSGGGGGNRRRDQHQQYNPPPPPSQQQQQQQQQQRLQQQASPQQHQQQANLPKNLVANDNISRTLSKFSPNDLLQAMDQVKTLINQDPNQAVQVLQSSNDLTYALVQAMLLMGLVDQNVVSQAVQGQVQQSGAPEPTAPPPPPPPQEQQQQAPQEQPPSQDEMIQQVMALTQSQIDSLPADQRDAIMAIRQQYAR